MTQPQVGQIQFRRALTRAFALPVLALALLTAVLIWQLNALLIDTRWVDHTDQVIAQAQTTQRLLIDMETGVRGFLLTGEADFRTPYDQAAPALDGQLGDLARLVADNPAQSERLAQMRPRIDSWRAFAANIIALRNSGGDYMAAVRSRSGKSLMDGLRSDLASFIGTEKQLRDQRSALAQRSAQIVVGTCIGLALLLALALALLTRRQLLELDGSYHRALAEANAHSAALDEQRERLSVTLASIGDAVIVADPDGTVTFINQVAQQLTGRPAEHATGQPLGQVFTIINEETRAPAFNPFDRVVREGVVVGLANHTLLVRPDGSEVPIDDSAAPVKDRAGQVIGVVLVFRDISEQKRAAEATTALTRQVENERRRLDNVIANVPGVVWESWGQPDAANQRIDFVSDYVERMLGYSREAWLSTANFWLTIVHPADREAAARRATETFQRGEPGINQFRWVARDGRVLWVETHSVTIRDDAGRPAGMRGVTLDISARKHAEAERARAAGQQRFLLDAGALLASSLEYELTLDRLAQLVVPQVADWCAVHLLDADDTVRRLAIAHRDPAKAELARQRPDRYPLDRDARHMVANVLRTGKPELFASVPDDVLVAAARDGEHLALLRSLGFSAYMCVPLTARDRMLGTITMVLADADRHYDANDLDMAEQLAARAAIAIDNARLYREAREAIRARDQFLSIASHELKTPITSLIGYTDLLLRRARRDGSLSERDERAVRIIGEQAGRLNRLIVALLDLSRIETGQLSIERGAVELNTLTQRLIQEFQQSQQPIHTITFAPSPAPLIVFGDELRLEQGIQNLIQNAIKYSPDGGSVAIELAQRGDHACLSVRDQGIGIPASAMPNLFRRFYRAPNVEQQHISGMGVGLFVVREIVQLHGGTIGVESAEGQGSTFTVCLPLMAEHSQADGQNGAQPGGHAAEPG